MSVLWESEANPNPTQLKTLTNRDMVRLEDIVTRHGRLTSGKPWMGDFESGRLVADIGVLLDLIRYQP